MKTIFAATLLSMSLLAAPHAEAAGCLSGAAMGGVAGHVAGHHGLLGAAAGCAVGHHMAVRNNRTRDQQMQTNQGQRQFDEGNTPVSR